MWFTFPINVEENVFFSTSQIADSHGLIGKQSVYKKIIWNINDILIWYTNVDNKYWMTARWFYKQFC